jgi:hypothetical protein
MAARPPVRNREGRQGPQGRAFGGRIDRGRGGAHVPPMASENPQPHAGPRLPVFPVACWMLGLMAFVQLLVAGMALATRLEDSRQVRVVEKEVLKPVIVRVPAPAKTPPPTEPSVVSRPPVPAAPALPDLPPTPLSVPQVADPRSELMVREGREARVAGDMGKAIVKLEEALEKSPEDPNVLYELGVVHEQMGVFDKAAEYYEQVFRQGVSGAGLLYQMAAGKLRDGFAQPIDMLGKLALGRVRIFNNPNHQGGQQVILTIPVQKAPGEEIDVAEIAVSVSFFNRTSKGDIVLLEDNSWVTENWVTLPFDWAGGEESLRMTYTIPPQDVQTEHLFGSRTYYGQVVTLTYMGEVLDVQAWPRDLAARIPRQPTGGSGELMLPEFQDTLPPDFDPDMPLLPPPLPE